MGPVIIIDSVSEGILIGLLFLFGHWYTEYLAFLRRDLRKKSTPRRFFRISIPISGGGSGFADLSDKWVDSHWIYSGLTGKDGETALQIICANQL